MISSKIIGTGSYIPTVVKKNDDFINTDFYGENNKKFPNSNEIIIRKFQAITGIEERRYLESNLTSSFMAATAAKRAIENAQIDAEELDYIIVAQNFGDVKNGQHQPDAVPSIASRVKHALQIDNPNCVAYDVIFGCPGWIEGVIQAHAFIKSGMAKKCLVIGSETLSRIADPHDRDSLIYSDGAGACILEKTDSSKGILGHASQTFAKDEAYFLYSDSSFNLEVDQRIGYMKMKGRKIYEFALNNVPKAMRLALERSGKNIDQINKILIHQANEKMDEAIVSRFYELFDKKTPDNIMPMSITKLGNSSVATVPTLLDLILKNQLDNHKINEGDVVLFASVGAGMNINAIVYQY